MDNTSDIFSDQSGWNDSLDEETNFTVPGNLNRKFFPVVNLFIILISTTNIAIACATTLLNACLLHTLSKVENSKLKAKRLIQCNSIANIILPVAHAIDLPFWATLLGSRDLSLMQCFAGVYFTIFILTSFSQSACSIGLALDRVYAVVRPLRYFTIGYSKLFRSFLVVFPWLAAILIWAVIFVASLRTMPPVLNTESVICSALFHTYNVAWKSMVFDAVLITFNSISFFVYMGIFVIINYQTNKMKRDKMSGARKMSLSLVITYSLLNITTLAFYLPTPLYSWLMRDVFQDESTRITYISTLRALLAVYLSNSYLDPIILMFRIQSIREKLPFQRTSKRTGLAGRPTPVPKTTADTHPRLPVCS